MLHQDNYSVVSVKLNFCQRQTHCIDDQEKVQSVTDTDNEFTECQTRRKNLLPIGISPVRLHAFMKTLKRDISEPCKVRVGCLKDSEFHCYNENDMEMKVNELVRLHKAMQEKLKIASYSERSQILTLVPDKWSQCTVQNIMSLNTLFELHMKSKKQVEYWQNLLLKKEKLSPLKHFVC